MSLMLLVLAAVVCSPAQAQPIDCSEYDHCPSGFYCEIDRHMCRECLHCEDLKREQPKVATSCIKSVIECGSCFKGLVDDHWGDAGCVPPDAREEAVLPIYVWVLIAICILIIASVVVVLLLRNTDTFNIKAFTRTSVQSPCPSPPATAPPPPYNDYYRPENNASPAPAYSPGIYDELSWPLVKSAPAPVPAYARESEGSQEARVFNNPDYVRVPHQLPSYEAPIVDSDQEAPFVPINEDTMESIWTPTVPTNDNANASDTAGSAASPGEAAAAGDSLAVALRRPSHSDAPPAKMVCLREDTNNNRNRENNGSGGDSYMAAAASGPSFVINVLNVNTVQQLGDIKL